MAISIRDEKIVHAYWDYFLIFYWIGQNNVDYVLNCTMKDKCGCNICDYEMVIKKATITVHKSTIYKKKSLNRQGVYGEKKKKMEC